MQTWIYFSLIAQIIWAVCSLIDKIVISKRHISNPLVYIALNGFTHMLVLLLLPFPGFELLKFTDFLIALLAGIMLSIAVAIYYKAVEYDEISKIKIMYQLTPIFVLIFSFLILGEVLAKNHFIGFVFLIVSGLAVSYQKYGKYVKLSKSFNLILLSMIIAAFSAVLAKYIYSTTSFWNAFLWLRITSISALAVLLVPSIRADFAKTFKNMDNRVKGLLSFKVLIDFSAFGFAGYALLNGQVSLVAAFETAVAPLFVFAITLFTSIYMPRIVKESIDKKAILVKISAIALIMIGVFFINLQ